MDLYIQDRRYYLTTYPKCFLGNQFVNWLISQGLAQDRETAISLGGELMDAGMMAHVCRDHVFKDEGLFYRFTLSDQDD